MPPLMAFIIGVLAGNLCGMFFVCWVVGLRVDEDAVSYKR